MKETIRRGLVISTPVSHFKALGSSFGCDTKYPKFDDAP